MTEIMREDERLYAGVGPALVIKGTFSTDAINEVECVIDMRVLLHAHWSKWASAIERAKAPFADIVMEDHGTDQISWSDPLLVLDYCWSSEPAS